MKLMKSISSLDLAQELNFEHFGLPQDIKNIAALGNLAPGSISFCKNKFDGRSRGVIIADEDFSSSSVTTLVTKNPRLGFIRLLNMLENQKLLVKPRIEPIIGKNVSIHPSCTIEYNTIIGDGCVIKSGAIIGEGTSLGAGVIIRENALIGADGFGYEKDSEGIPIHFPHISGVELGDKVEVGSNTIICRGTLTPTIVGLATKINASSFIGHNVQIGSCTLVHAGVVASGGCVIGHHCWIGTNATVLEKRTINDYVTIGSGAVVNRDIDAYTKAVGNPARILSD